MDLTTRNRVKTFLGIGDSETQFDELLTQIVRDVSGEVEAYLNRTIKNTGADITEYADVASGQNTIQVNAYPIISVTSIYNDVSREFDASSAIDADDYAVQNSMGIIQFDYPLMAGFKAVKIVYRGGMATTTTAFMAAYPNITSAATLEVVHRFQRRNTVGLVGITVGGGSATIGQKSQFLPVVEQALDAEVRWL